MKYVSVRIEGGRQDFQRALPVFCPLDGFPNERVSSRAGRCCRWISPQGVLLQAHRGISRGGQMGLRSPSVGSSD